MEYFRKDFIREGFCRRGVLSGHRTEFIVRKREFSITAHIEFSFKKQFVIFFLSDLGFSDRESQYPDND